MMRDDDDADTWDDEPPDLAAPRVKHLGKVLSLGGAIKEALGTSDASADKYPKTLPCRFCRRELPMEPFVFETFAKLSKTLVERGQRPIDPVTNVADRPLCPDCQAKQDSHRAALDHERHQEYLAAKRRLLATTRPDTAEEVDWRTIRDHGGDVEIRDLRARRQRKPGGTL